MPSRTRARTRSTAASSTSPWATCPHQVRTSVSASVASLSPWSGSSSDAVRTSWPASRSPSAMTASIPVRVDRSDGRIAALLSVLRPDGDPGHDAATVRLGFGRTPSADRIGTGLASVTTAPAVRAERRIASHRRAIREPHFGRIGIRELPRAHVEIRPPHRGRRLDRDRPQPCPTGPLELQQLTVDPRPQDRTGREEADVRVARWDGPTAGVHRHEGAGREAAHHDRADVHRIAVVLLPSRDFGEVLAGQVGHRVEHVGAGIEQEAAARCLRLLPPGPSSVRRPVLPHHRGDVEDRAEVPGPQQASRFTTPRGERPLERDHERSPVRSRVAINASASPAVIVIGFSRITSSPASRQAVACSKCRT